MTRFAQGILLLAVLMLLQVSLLPAVLADPFKPNLLIIAVVWLGLNGDARSGFLIFLLGLIQDCFSGIYLGLNSFTFLVIFLCLRLTADRLYTDSPYLLVGTVFLATIAGGLIHLALLVIFSVAPGVYAVLLPALVPQSLVNSLATSLFVAIRRESSAGDVT